MRAVLPAPVAREVDRLARGAHRRTAWAHHPLCGRYGEETLRLGRRVVCRGCALAALGALSGLGAALVLAPSPAMSALGCLALAAPAAVGLAVRLPKLATRALPGAALGASLGALVARPSLAALALVVALAVALLVHTAFYRRRGPDRSPCATCPERAQAPSCAGFAPLLRRERAFSRLAGRIISRGARL